MSGGEEIQALIRYRLDQAGDALRVAASRRMLARRATL